VFFLSAEKEKKACHKKGEKSQSNFTASEQRFRYKCETNKNCKKIFLISNVGKKTKFSIKKYEKYRVNT
jgi:hypothetical protein